MDHYSDQNLLREYAETGSEAAFAELVRRYLDFAYSVARRTVGASDLAKDVAQSVFIVLAHECRRVAGHAVLAGWVHRTTHHLAVKAVRTEARRRQREQQAVAMNELSSGEPEPSWEALSPHLDALLEQLKPEDRDVVLLRYFQQKSAREIAAVLGLSEEAAQKRAARALERLRSAFEARGIMTSSALVAALLSANAVQAAPVGLGIGIAAAAAASHSAASAGLIKVIAMTTMQKVAVTTAVVVAVGSAVYEAQRASRLERKLTVLQQQPQTLPQTKAELPRLETQAPAVAQPSTPVRVFDWREVESSDYLQYLANLRALGCPEKTVRDIILADVNDLYRQRLRAAMPATNRFEYWKAGNPFAQLMSEQMTNVQALAGERRQLVTALLGSQAEQGADNFSATELYDVVNAHILDFLTSEKQTAALETLNQYAARLSSLDRRDRKTYKQALAGKDAALLQVLSPEEKFELDLRKSHTSDGLRAALRGAEVTEDEFRQLFRLQKQYDDDFGPPLYAPEGAKAVAAHQTLQQDVRNMLGEERYRVFWDNQHPRR